MTVHVLRVLVRLQDETRVGHYNNITSGFGQGEGPTDTVACNVEHSCHIYIYIYICTRIIHLPSLTSIYGRYWYNGEDEPVFLVTQTAVEDKFPQSQQERSSLPPSAMRQPHTHKHQREIGKQQHRHSFRPVPVHIHHTHTL